jgi:sulfur relay (sulfurtransferase) DsrC/TusE family protein
LFLLKNNTYGEYEEITNIAKEKFISLLQEGAYYSAVEIQKEFLENEIDFFESQEIINAAKQGVTLSLERGDFDTALTIQKEFLENEIDFFESQEIINAAKQGFFFCCKYKNINKALDIQHHFLQDFPDILYLGVLFSLKTHNEYLEHLYKAKNIAEVSSLTQENWVWAFALYSASSVAEEGENISEETKEHLKLLFQNTKNQNFVLKNLKELYKKILYREKMTDEEEILLSVIDKTGAGNLAVCESFSNFLYTISGKEILYESLQKTKKHFEKLKVSDQDFGQWCFLSTPFIETFPEIFQEYLPVFLKMNDKDFSLYLEEVFLLHSVLLLLGENNETLLKTGKEFFQEFISRITSQTEENINISEEHKKVFVCIKENLQKSFGLKKIPESFDAEMIRSVKNFSMYFANLHDKDEEKETYLGLFFALHLHNKWNDFLTGNMSYDEVCEYIEDDTEYIKDYMKNREKNISLFQEFSLEERQKFHISKIFQGYADISTIDTKLQSIEKDIEDLLDFDMYSEEEKKLLLLLQKHKKQFGGVLAKLWQKKGGKDISFTEDEENIMKEIQNEQFSIETQEEIKKIQDDLNIFFGNKMVNLQNKVKEYHIPEKLKNLKQAKTPSEEIMAIFIKCGVAFETDSGAQAISSDIEYLRKVLSTTGKQKNILTEEEKEKGEKYLKGIETQVKALEALLKKILDPLKNYTFHEKDTLKKERFEEFMKKLEQKGGESLVYTTMTSDMNEVIPRIRACLSCRNKECNNDTNLSFGDGYRFFLFSDFGGKKDCSDQIVNILPTPEKEHYFVFDTLYGERGLDILALHIATVLEQSKETGLPVFLPKRVLSFEEKEVQQKIENYLKKKTQWKEKSLTLVVPKKSGEDFYQEFTRGARNSGEKIVEGYEISL